jgi:ectoine hydroxylase-related dioxygenase (phytanoyl-CoA dioxygenase family)
MPTATAPLPPADGPALVHHVPVDAADRAAAAGLPLGHRFTLGQQITGVQAAFFAQHGFLVFGGVAQRAELDLILGELEGVQARWIAEQRKKVNGIPLFVGKDPDGRPFIQRFTFTSMFSEPLRRFVLDPRFEPVRRMVGPEARVGHDEHDGVVINRYINVPGSVYPRLGWHTDGLRDVAYLRKPQAMFNVGLHFDEISAKDGGLRLIPGSHTQGLWDMAFRKLYFLDHRPDPAEIAVETQPGDLTVHDGRLWHRVAQSPHTGWRSLRRSMYVPYQTGPLATKAEDSPTPIYHTIGRALRWFKKRG